jgi:hypothetical protein
MKLRRFVYLPVVAALGVFAGTRARGQEIPASSQNPNTPAVQRPVRKPDQVITTDSIARLALRDASDTVVPASGAAGVKKEQTATENDATKKSAEIAVLDQQIQDKQKRIALLLRLFVNDERAFLMDPANAKADGAVAERCRYEQDELRWETAELAKLKARREQVGVASQ